MLHAHSKIASRQVEIISAKCVTGPWVKEKFLSLKNIHMLGPCALYNHLALTLLEKCLTVGPCLSKYFKSCFIFLMEIG